MLFLVLHYLASPTMASRLGPGAEQAVQQLCDTSVQRRLLPQRTDFTGTCTASSLAPLLPCHSRRTTRVALALPARARRRSTRVHAGAAARPPPARAAGRPAHAAAAAADQQAAAGRPRLPRRARPQNAAGAGAPLPPPTTRVISGSHQCAGPRGSRHGHVFGPTHGGPGAAARLLSRHASRCRSSRVLHHPSSLHRRQAAAAAPPARCAAHPAGHPTASQRRSFAGGACRRRPGSCPGAARQRGLRHAASGVAPRPAAAGVRGLRGRPERGRAAGARRAARVGRPGGPAAAPRAHHARAPHGRVLRGDDAGWAAPGHGLGRLAGQGQCPRCCERVSGISGAERAAGAQGACGGARPRPQIWSLQGGRLLKTCRGHEAEISDLVLSPNHELLASASHDCTIRIWSLKVRRPCLLHMVSTWPCRCQSL